VCVGSMEWGYDRDERGRQSPLGLGSQKGPGSRLGSDIGVGDGMGRVL